MSDIVHLVIADMEARRLKGTLHYGVALETNSANDALTDAYEEALDLVFYLRQELERRDAEYERQSEQGDAFNEAEFQSNEAARLRAAIDAAQEPLGLAYRAVIENRWGDAQMLIASVQHKLAP